MRGASWGRCGLVALAALGCHMPPWASDRAACPVSLVAAGDLPRDLRARYRARLHFDDRELKLEVVADRVSEEVVVVGLAPWGVRLFAVHQRGREAEVGTPFRELEKIGLWTLDALHRAFWIEPPAGAAPPPSQWIRGDERVREWRRDGRLLRREFAATDRARAAGVVSIDYAAADGNASRPGIRIRNPWCGYEALLIGSQSPEVNTGGGPRPESRGEGAPWIGARAAAIPSPPGRR